MSAATARLAPRPIDLAPLPAPGALLRASLALFVFVAVARLPDALPFLYVIPYGKVLGGMMIVGAATGMPAGAWSRALGHPGYRAFLVIMALAVLSVPFSLWPGGSLDFLLNAFAPAAVFFLVLVPTAAHRPTARLLSVALVVGIAAVALRILLAPQIEDGRAATVSLDPNDTGGYLVPTIPIAIYLASTGRGLLWKLFFLVPPLLVAALARTGSRGGFLALLAMGAWLVWLSPPRRRLRYLLLSVVGGAVFLGFAQGAIRERFVSTFSPDADYNTYSSEGRLEIWKRGIGYMLRRPILGVGIGGFPIAEGTLAGKQQRGTFVKYSAAHNSFVQIGAELGVGGFSAFTLIVVTSVFGCVRHRRKAVARRATQGALSDAEAAFQSAAAASVIGIVTAGFFLSFAYMPLTVMCFGSAIAATLGSPFARTVPGRGGHAHPAASRLDAGPVARLARAPGRRGGLEGGGALAPLWHRSTRS